MKVTLQQVLDAMPAVSQFAQKELPAKAAYRISKLVKKLNSEARDLQEQRNRLIEKYGHKVLKGEQWVMEVRPENIGAFMAELKTLLSEEVELEGVASIKFADIEHLNLSPAVLSDLDFMIEAPAEEVI